jgi:hypothetical protein
MYTISPLTENLKTSQKNTNTEYHVERLATNFFASTEREWYM